MFVTLQRKTFYTTQIFHFYSTFILQEISSIKKDSDAVKNCLSYIHVYMYNIQNTNIKTTTISKDKDYKEKITHKYSKYCNTI
jgi:hypothetical protein